MQGYLGNDTYYVDNIDDNVWENLNEGIDEVKSSVNYNLWDNIENLTLIGVEDLTGGGNLLNNLITGNAGNNSISGYEGDDSINAGAGNDTIDDFAGNETYMFDSGDGIDTIVDSTGDDKISFGSNVLKENIAVYKDSSDNLIIDYSASSGQDRLTIQNQVSNTIENFELANSEFLTDSDIDQIIQNMTSYANNNSINLTSIEDVKNNQDLMNFVINAWHS